MQNVNISVVPDNQWYPRHDRTDVKDTVSYPKVYHDGYTISVNSDWYESVSKKHSINSAGEILVDIQHKKGTVTVVEDKNICPPFKEWTLHGNATVDGDGVLTLPKGADNFAIVRVNWDYVPDGISLGADVVSGGKLLLNAFYFDGNARPVQEDGNKWMSNGAVSNFVKGIGNRTSPFPSISRAKYVDIKLTNHPSYADQDIVKLKDPWVYPYDNTSRVYRTYDNTNGEVKVGFGVITNPTGVENLLHGGHINVTSQMHNHTNAVSKEELVSNAQYSALIKANMINKDKKFILLDGKNKNNQVNLMPDAGYHYGTYNQKYRDGEQYTAEERKQVNVFKRPYTTVEYVTLEYMTLTKGPVPITNTALSYPKATWELPYRESNYTLLLTRKFYEPLLIQFAINPTTPNPPMIKAEMVRKPSTWKDESITQEISFGRIVQSDVNRRPSDSYLKSQGTKGSKMITTSHEFIDGEKTGHTKNVRENITRQAVNEVYVQGTGVVTWVNKTRTEPVKFTSSTYQSDQYYEGERITTTQGRDGVRTYRWEEEHLNGTSTGIKRNETNSITTQPTNERIAIGTKPRVKTITLNRLFVYADTQGVYVTEGYEELKNIGLTKFIGATINNKYYPITLRTGDISNWLTLVGMPTDSVENGYIDITFTYQMD